MNCERFTELSDLFLVDEVRASEREQIEAHLTDCPACSAQLALDRAIRQSLVRGGQDVTASPALRQRIEASLAAPAKAAPARRRRARRLLAAAVLLLAVGLGIYYTQAIRPGWTPSRDMVQTHVYYLKQQEAPYQVVTPDSKALAGWIEARLDHRVELADGAWDLLGARISAVNEHKAGLVFYEDRGVRISYFIFPAETIDLVGLKKVEIRGLTRWHGFHQGYRVLIWKDGPLYYGLVSDANTGDMVWR